MSTRTKRSRLEPANLGRDRFITYNEVVITMIEEPRSVADILKAPIIVPPGKKPIRLLACGVEKGVEGIIHQLHVLRFAEVGEWSQPLPSPVQDEVIRILTRHIIISG